MLYKQEVRSVFIKNGQEVEFIKKNTTEKKSAYWRELGSLTAF